MNEVSQSICGLPGVFEKQVTDWKGIERRVSKRKMSDISSLCRYFINVTKSHFLVNTIADRATSNVELGIF